MAEYQADEVTLGSRKKRELQNLYWIVLTAGSR